MVIETALQSFLKSAAGRQFKYGEFDCGLWLADWLVILGRPDPAATLRGTYDAAGNFLFTIYRTLHAAGLQRTNAPMIGDVGIIRIGPESCVGSICTGKRWAVLAEGKGVSALGMTLVRKFIAWKA